MTAASPHPCQMPFWVRLDLSIKTAYSPQSCSPCPSLELHDIARGAGMGTWLWSGSGLWWSQPSHSYRLLLMHCLAKHLQWLLSLHSDAVPDLSRVHFSQLCTLLGCSIPCPSVELYHGASGAVAGTWLRLEHGLGVLQETGQSPGAV